MTGSATTTILFIRQNGSCRSRLQTTGFSFLNKKTGFTKEGERLFSPQRCNRGLKVKEKKSNTAPSSKQYVGEIRLRLCCHWNDVLFLWDRNGDEFD